jgi:hypothetical protein
LQRDQLGPLLEQRAAEERLDRVVRFDLLGEAFIMSARMSLSENTAAKRSFGLSCAHAGMMPAAAMAAPALSA